MYDDNADKATVIIVLSGNSEAYGDIVQKYKNIVFNVIYAMIKDYHTAEDLTQETFIDGYIKLKSLGEPYNVGAWLVKIAKNKCYNHITRSAVKLESELHDYIPDTRTSTPESYFIEQQERQSLIHAVKLLPELYRTVTELYYFHNLSQNAIAERLKIPIGTVSRRLHEARLKLKKEFDSMNENIKNINFEAEVAKKIKSIQNYYHLNNFSMDGIDKIVDEFIKFIDTMPESKLKHNAYALAYSNSGKEEYKPKIEKEAELGENADVYHGLFWDKYANKDNDEDWLRAIDSEEGLQRLEKMENSDSAVGAMLFWRGACNMRAKRFKEAKIDFEKALTKLKRDESYHPNAVACIKAIDILMPEHEKYISGYNMTGECYRLYNDGKQLDFVYQPGFGDSYPVYGINRFDCIYYYASNGGINHNRWFFNLSEDKTLGDEIIVTENETVSVLAGTFSDCLHICLDTKEEWAFSSIYEIWYAKDVGLIKFRVKIDNNAEEIYELCEYNIKGGNGYMPAEVGNIWRYKNVNLSDLYQQINEYEIVSVIDDLETKSKYIYMAVMQILRSSKDNCDSDTHIALAQDALPNEKPEKWDFYTAITNLKLANQKNTSVRATLFSSNAVEFIERCAGYYQKGWHFLPSSVNGCIINKYPENDKIIYKENEIYHLGPYVNWGSWYGARRCIGLKPFRFLQGLAGTLYSEKWVAGYSDAFKNDDGTVHLIVEDGGTITTKAGTFDNCIKVTFDLEWEGGAADEKYYLHNLRYSHCGTKIYWYAPNVGIIKHDCIWGKALTSSIELTEYKSCATNNEYMPIYVGNRWIYDEVTLPPNFIARKKYDLVSGIEDEFFMIEEQEMLFMGTDDEYEKINQYYNKVN